MGTSSAPNGMAAREKGDRGCFTVGVPQHPKKGPGHGKRSINCKNCSLGTRHSLSPGARCTTHWPAFPAITGHFFAEPKGVGPLRQSALESAGNTGSTGDVFASSRSDVAYNFKHCEKLESGSLRVSTSANLEASRHSISENWLLAVTAKAGDERQISSRDWVVLRISNPRQQASRWGRREQFNKPFRLNCFQLPGTRVRHVFTPLRDCAARNSEQFRQRRSVSCKFNGFFRLHKVTSLPH